MALQYRMIQNTHHLKGCFVTFAENNIMASKEVSDLSKSVLEMAAVANQFCYYIENPEQKSKKELLEFFHRILPLLYLKGSLLPEITPDYPEANERFITEVQWEDVFTSLREIFGKEDEYWIIDPQYTYETEPIKTSLAENFTDIYQDMKDFLMLLQKNTLAAQQNAVHECKNLMQSHWGYRVGNTIARVHHLLFDDEEISEMI